MAKDKMGTPLKRASKTPGSDAGNYLTIYFPDARVKRRVEKEARRLGLSASNLAGNLIEAVIGVVEDTPLNQIGALGQRMEEELGGERDADDDPGVPAGDGEAAAAEGAEAAGDEDE